MLWLYQKIKINTMEKKQKETTSSEVVREHCEGIYVSLINA